MSGSSQRRGAQWEDIIERSLQRVEDSVIMRMTPPVKVVRWLTGRGHGGEFRGYFSSGGPLDFEGAVCGVHTVVEAKRTGQKRWYFQKAITPHQWDRLYRVSQQPGSAAYVFVMMDNEVTPTFFAITFGALWDLADSGVKGLTKETLREHGTELQVVSYGYDGPTVNVEIVLQRRLDTA